MPKITANDLRERLREHNTPVPTGIGLFEFSALDKHKPYSDRMCKAREAQRNELHMASVSLRVLGQNKIAAEVERVVQELEHQINHWHGEEHS